MHGKVSSNGDEGVGEGPMCSSVFCANDQRCSVFPFDGDDSSAVVEGI